MIQHSQPITPLGHLLVLALVIPINVTPGLLEKGHRVTLAVEQVHYPLVQSLFGPMGNKFGDRFVFVGLDGDIESLQKTVQWQEQVAKRDAYSLMTAIREMTERAYLTNGRRLLEAIKGAKHGENPSAMVINLTVWLQTLPIAEGLKIPLIVASFIPPAFPSPETPPVLLSPLPFRLGWLNLLAQRLMVEIFVGTVGNKDDIAILQQECGAATLDVRLSLLTFMSLPFALAYPTLLFPNPPSWRQKGYKAIPCGAFTDRLLPPSLLAGFDPAADGHTRDLQAFLDADPEKKPVFISWGSIVGVRADLARLAVRALLLSKKRGVIQRGWAGVSLSQLHPEEDAELLTYAQQGGVFELHTPVPHTWLFPRCSVIVHHGGCGTTSTALYAGVPQVVLPVLSDQPFWAVRVGVVGIGPQLPCSAYDVTAERLADMIAEVSTPECAERAREAKAEAEKEDGVAKAIAVIESEAARGGAAFWEEVLDQREEEEKRRVREARWIVMGSVVGVGALITLTVRRWRSRR